MVDHGCQLDACRFRKHNGVVSCGLGLDAQSVFEFGSCGAQFCKHFLLAFVSEHQALFSGGRGCEVRTPHRNTARRCCSVTPVTKALSTVEGLGKGWLGSTVRVSDWPQSLPWLSNHQFFPDPYPSPKSS